MVRVAVVEDNEADFRKIEACFSRLHEEDGVQFDLQWYRTGAAFIGRYAMDCDIVLMDIDMPVMDGIEAARALRQMDQTVVLIFVTNMAQYAIAGYEVEAFDFILKPVNPYSFAIKMRRAIARTIKRNDDTISVKVDGEIFRLYISGIKYIEVSGHYVVYHTTSGEFTEYATLKEAEKKVNRSYFVRCSQSVLINLKYVDSVNRETVVVGGREMPISRRMHRAFFAAITDFFGGKDA